MKDLPRIQHDGETWLVLGTGVNRGGKTYCHLKSAGLARPDGSHTMIVDWVPNGVLRSAGVTVNRHTPGPWQINSKDRSQVLDSHGSTRGCAPIAHCVGTESEARANAKLISAAPDMLKALKDFLEDYSSEDGLGPMKYYARVAQDAIAKATA